MSFRRPRKLVSPAAPLLFGPAGANVGPDRLIALAMGGMGPRRWLPPPEIA